MNIQPETTTVRKTRKSERFKRIKKVNVERFLHCKTKKIPK